MAATGTALAAITVGGWFAYSALTGQSLAGVFKGGDKKLDPSASVNPRVPAADNPQTAGGGNSMTGIEGEMNRMIALHNPYKWGGGHAQFDPDGPWDCSGAVSWLLHWLGFLDGHPLTSGQLMAWGDSGRGPIFTVYANPTHTFVKMETGKYAGKCWGTTSRIPSQGGSLAWHDHTTVGFVARHPKMSAFKGGTGGGDF
jgi:hypothetical protein